MSEKSASFCQTDTYSRPLRAGGDYCGDAGRQPGSSRHRRRLGRSSWPPTFRRMSRRQIAESTAYNRCRL